MKKLSLNLVSLRMREFEAEALAQIANKFSAADALEIGHGDVDATFLVPGDFSELVFFLYGQAGERPGRRVKIYSLSAFETAGDEFELLI